MSDLTNFNSTFFLSLATMTFGFCAGALGYALKSKCNSVKLCYGCLEIERDVELEADIEQPSSVAAPTTIDSIPNSPQPSRRSSVRRSYNVTDAINALNNHSTKEEAKEKIIDFGKSMI